MTQGQQDRPEDESEEQQPQAEESQQANYVPGSAADPRMGQGSTGTRGPAYYGPVSNPEERNWSMLVHLSALSGIFTSGIGKHPWPDHCLAHLPGTGRTWSTITARGPSISISVSLSTASDQFC